MLFRFLARQWIQVTAKNAVVEMARRSGEAQQEGDREQEHINATLPPCDVAVICADHIESMGLRGLLEDVVTTRCARLLEHAGHVAGHRVVIAEAGTGAENAGLATEDIIQMHHPRWVIAAGFATALDPSLQHQHLLMADPVVDSQGSQLQLGTSWDQEAMEGQEELHLGALLSHEEIVHTPSERQQFAKQYDAMAVDIETIGIARACQEGQVPCLVIRVITETLDEEFPIEVITMIQQNTTAGKLGAFTRAMFHGLGSVKEMWNIKDRAFKASERLGRYLVSVIRQLPTK
jgi:adenosylhomocysteine nucleosidase